MATQIAMRVSEEEKQKIQKQCKDKGMTIYGLIRIALDQYFKDQNKK